jgi:hypothetical protein
MLLIKQFNNSACGFCLVGKRRQQAREKTRREGREGGRSPPLRLCESTVEDILLFLTASSCMKNLIFFRACFLFSSKRNFLEISI